MEIIGAGDRLFLDAAEISLTGDGFKSVSREIDVRTDRGIINQFIWPTSFHSTDGCYQTFLLLTLDFLLKLRK